MRFGLACCLIGLSLVGLCTAQESHASIRQDTNIPAEPLDQALRTLAKERQFQVLYRAELVQDVRTAGAVGAYTLEEALKQLLSGTGLSYKYLDASTVTIVPVALVTAGTPTDQAQTSPNNTQDNSKEVGKKSSQDFRVAQATSGQTAGADSVELPQKQVPQSEGGLQEIIVTAQKREERLLDVPVPVTAISADTLVENDQTRLQDYYTSVPGLSVTPGDEHGAPQLAIRGITTGGFSNPTVGIVIDDIPYGASFGAVYGNEAPDIDPSDLARVEVLRGPQGTLYGASSLGGLLKYVTVDPSTAGVSGSLQTSTSTVYNGVGLSYGTRAAFNLPLTDDLAIRVSGFTRHDAGYVDNVQTGQNGVNSGDAYGGRISSLWRPSDSISLKLSALVQYGKVDGSPSVDVEPGLGDLQQSDLQGTGWRTNRIQAYSANLNVQLGKFTLTYLSGYSINEDADSYDFSSPTTGFGYFTEQYFGPSGAGAPLTENVTTDKFTQELRLAGPITDHIDWLMGGFYNHEYTHLIEDVLGANPVTGVPVGSYGYFDVPTAFAEFAAFTDFTFHLTDRFQVQLGGRESRNTQSFSQTVIGPYDPDILQLSSPVIYPKEHSTASSFTYLVTPQLKITPDVLLYARLASGYRPGGPNIFDTSSALPSRYDPDKTKNYEIGLKGEFLDHRLVIDGSVYYIDWNDIQLQLRDPTTHITYYANGSRAKSEGVELSTIMKPVSGLTLSAWVAYDDAVLTENLPATSTAYGLAGDRLPNSARISGNADVEDDFRVTDQMRGFVGGTESYVGDRLSVFTNSSQRQDFPAYAQTNLRAGVRFDSWTVNLFANNITDKRGVLSGGIGSLNPIAFYYIQPRTVGLSAQKIF